MAMAIMMGIDSKISMLFAVVVVGGGAAATAGGSGSGNDSDDHHDEYEATRTTQWARSNTMGS